MAVSPASAAIEAIWRIESPKVVARVARVVGDVGLAEDLAQDALVAALEQWPRTGVPANPGAWLMVAAKRRAIDVLRRDEVLRRKQPLLAAGLDPHEDRDLAAELDDDLGDDLLRLVFTCCHPVLAPEARVALTLKLAAGLSTAAIARAFLVPEATLAQRVVRAKRTLARAQVPFEVPAGAERAGRLASVLEVVYLVFNEGHAAAGGELVEDALRLARVLARLLPREPEVHGLVALLELTAARLPARRDGQGRPVLLADQDRARWDRLLVRRGLDALGRAQALARPLGPYALQAAIAACHAQAPSVRDTDWEAVVALYDALHALTGSPVVALNRAVAVAMADGPQAGLDAVDALAGERALEGYHLLPSVRGDLLERLGRFDEARLAFEQAAALAADPHDRALLLQRATTAGVAP